MAAKASAQIMVRKLVQLLSPGVARELTSFSLRRDTYMKYVLQSLGAQQR